jgi:fructose-specific component phosphotransferase system IIB-like protein
MATILEKANQILNEKNTKILPNTLKQGTSFFDVNGELVELIGQEKTVTPSEVEQVITPDEGFTGITKVTVAAAEGGGIKQFTTEEEMNTFNNETEGDLAIVYGDIIANMSATSKVQIIKFPSTVVLPEAFTSDAYCMLSAVDSNNYYFNGQVMLSATNFSFSGNGDSGRITVTYNSSDGLTYTRTDGGAEMIDCGCQIKCRYEDEWNDNIGYFMQTSSPHFGGLFQNKYYIDKTEVQLQPISALELTLDTSASTGIGSAKLTSNPLPTIYKLADLAEVYNSIMASTEVGTSKPSALSLCIDKDGDLVFIQSYDTSTNKLNSICYFTLTYDTNGKFLGIYDGYMSSHNYYKVYKIDLINKTYSLKSTLTAKASDWTNSYRLSGIETTTIPIKISSTYASYDFKLTIHAEEYDGNGSYGYNYVTDLSNTQYVAKYGYFIAPTQLTTKAVEVYGTEFYGKNGIQTGTLQNSNANNVNQLKIKMELWSIFNEVTFEMTNLDSCFASTAIKTIPLIDTSKVTSMNSTFYKCSSLETIPLIDTSNVTSMNCTFHVCESLKSCPLINTSNVTDFSSIFGYCKSLKELPLLDTSNATRLNSMVTGCTSITEIPQYNTSKVTQMQNTFSGCTSLVTIPVLDTSALSGQYGWYDTFKDCPNLSNTTLNNVLKMCINAKSYTGTKTLANLGITSDQANICKTLSNYSAFTAAGWTTGY